MIKMVFLYLTMDVPQPAVRLPIRLWNLRLQILILHQPVKSKEYALVPRKSQHCFLQGWKMEQHLQLQMVFSA